MTLKKTVAEWDALEASKLADLEQLKAKAKKTDARRADAILLLGDTPDDKNAKKQLEEIEAERKQLAVEIESVSALLGAIPERRKHARAVEIENEIAYLLDLEKRLIAEAPKIDAAAEAYVLTCKSFYILLDEMQKKNSWAFLGHYPDVSNLAVSFFMGQHKLRPIDKNEKPLVEGVKEHPTLKELQKLLFNMRESAKQLRGQEISNSLGYCSHCFGVGKYSSGTSNTVCCAKCGRIIKE